LDLADIETEIEQTHEHSDHGGLVGDVATNKRAGGGAVATMFPDSTRSWASTSSLTSPPIRTSYAHCGIGVTFLLAGLISTLSCVPAAAPHPSG
jgi:hypothetical protein